MATPSTSTPDAKEWLCLAFRIRIYIRYEKALVRMLGHGEWHNPVHVQARSRLRAWRDEFLAIIDEEINCERAPKA